MQVRVLTFNNDLAGDHDRFSLLYQGFVTGGNLIERKTMEVTRLEAKILDKFEAISTPTDLELIRQLSPTDSKVQVLKFEEPEFALVRKYFEGTPWKTTTSRRAVDVFDWLVATPQSEG
jgi:hypothetical protein